MKRHATTITAIFIAGIAAGCSEQSVGPLSSETFDAAASTSPAVHVLNTQLRGIIDPDIEPTQAWGHVQIRLTDDGEAGYRIEWKGKLFNPDREIFSGAFIINPDINPGPLPGDGEPTGDGLIFSFFRGATQSCDVLVFDSQAADEMHLEPDVAMNMIINPEIHEVLLVSTEGSLVAGRFGLPDPTEILGFNPQPDPPGRIVRCDVEDAS